MIFQHPVSAAMSCCGYLGDAYFPVCHYKHAQPPQMSLVASAVRVSIMQDYRATCGPAAVAIQVYRRGMIRLSVHAIEMP